MQLDFLIKVMVKINSISGKSVIHFYQIFNALDSKNMYLIIFGQNMEIPLKVGHNEEIID